MTKPKAEILAAIHEDALREFDRVQTAQRDERLQCLEDRRFYSIAGAQWEGPAGELFDNKPRFEINKTHLAVIRVINEYRNNRVSVMFEAKDGQDGDELADTCAGLYRADERDSGAEEAYDNAFEEACGGGMGAWRLRTCYEDDDDDEDERQRIRFEPIHDADSCVFFDLDAKRQDKSDAKKCWVLIPYTPEAYKEQFNDDPATWDKSIFNTQFDWCQPDLVWVAEHYRIEEYTETVKVFRGLLGEEKRVKRSEELADPHMISGLEARGYHQVREKKVERRRVHKYLMSGTGILEDCGVIAGKYIPIIASFGKRWVVDGAERCQGHVRLAKDAQRLVNMLTSWLAEVASNSPVEKPILAPAQIKGHETMWAQDGIENYPYLLANPLEDANGQIVAAGPVGVKSPPKIPEAIAALAQLVGVDLKELLGNQEAGEEMRSNISQGVVELVQQRLDMQVFIYMDNHKKAVRHCGRVWLSMMKDIAVEESRRMKTVATDGQVGTVVINEPGWDPDAGTEITRNDMSSATFDVVADVGPSSSSKRAATLRAVTSMSAITDDPEMKQALQLVGLENLEGEGLAGLRKWARRKGIRLGIVEPNDEEKAQLAQEMATAQPDPQQELLRAAANQADADAALSRAGTVDKIASAQLKLAQTDKTVAETAGAHNDQRIATADALQRVLQPPTTPQGSNS